jgi:beta-glucanase (GH16 family)
MAAARRATSSAISRGRAAARAVSSAARPIAARAPQTLSAAADPALRAFSAGLSRTRAFLAEAATACAPHVLGLRAGLVALADVLVHVLAWLRWAAGPAAITLALAVATAAVVAPVALMVATGIASIQAALPQKEAGIIQAPTDANIDFIDRFTRLNTQRWGVSDWANTALADNDWRRSQVSVTPEGLAITLAANPPGADKPYVSGEIFTHERYLYGYYEARMRAPRGEGLVVGFFTFTRPGGRSSWDEIDMEFLGRDPRWLELALHAGGRSQNKIVVLPFDASADFHTYGFEWRPDAIRWYVDNVLVHEVRGERVERMTRPQRFYLNLWNSSALYRWVGRIEPNEAPWTLTVSCVARALEYRGASLCAP